MPPTRHAQKSKAFSGRLSSKLRSALEAFHAGFHAFHKIRLCCASHQSSTLRSPSREAALVHRAACIDHCDSALIVLSVCSSVPRGIPKDRTSRITFEDPSSRTACEIQIEVLRTRSLSCSLRDAAICFRKRLLQLCCPSPCPLLVKPACPPARQCRTRAARRESLIKSTQIGDRQITAA